MLVLIKRGQCRKRSTVRMIEGVKRIWSFWSDGAGETRRVDFLIEASCVSTSAIIAKPRVPFKRGLWI